jgi:hypothetical protein
MDATGFARQVSMALSSRWADLVGAAIGGATLILSGWGVQELLGFPARDCFCLPFLDPSHTRGVRQSTKRR